MGPTDAIFHRQDPRLLPCRSCRGISPLPVCCPPQELSCQPSLHLGLRPPQGLAHVGGDHPGIRYKDQYHLDHGLKKETGHPRCRSLPAEDARHLTTNPICPGQVPHHHWPVVTRCQDHPPQVFEGGHHLQGEPIGAESPGSDLTLLLRR